jgi:hypothetical protein
MAPGAAAQGEQDEPSHGFGACQAAAGGNVTEDASLLRIHPGGQSDSSEVHASNDPKLAHSPAKAGDAG